MVLVALEYSLDCIIIHSIFQIAGQAKTLGGTVQISSNQTGSRLPALNFDSSGLNMLRI
jgi:hypothetical protein